MISILKKFICSSSLILSLAVNSYAQPPIPKAMPEVVQRDCAFEAAEYFAECVSGDSLSYAIFCYKDPGEMGFGDCIRNIVGIDVSDEIVNDCLSAAVSYENTCLSPPKVEPL